MEKTEKEEMKEEINKTKDDIEEEAEKDSLNADETKNKDKIVKGTAESEVKMDEDIEGKNEHIDEEKKENILAEPEVVKDSKLHKYTIAISIIASILVIFAIVFSIVFALINKNTNTIISGISIKGIDVSGLDKVTASNKINQTISSKLEQNAKIVYNDYIVEVMPDQIEASFGIQDSVNLAYSIGRTGKILKDNYSIVNAYLSKIDINPVFSYNDEKLNNLISEISENLPGKVEQSSYTIDGDKLIVSKGKSGIIVKSDELKNMIINNIETLQLDNMEIIIPVENKEPDSVNIEQIKNEIYKEAKDAYYTKDPFTVYPHVNGVDIDISLEEAKNLLNTEENIVTIPLKITVPKVTTNQIGTEAFPDLLASFSTTFSTANTNRTTNIKLAANKINGVVLLPGQTFSYNEVVGKRTAAAGYKSAAVYVNGKVENGIGGGICQVSSTLYNTVLKANLEIVKRSNHRFYPGYVKLGFDATVSWGGPEFIFKNSRKYPIKIVAKVTGGTLRVDIYGCKEEVEYDVSLISETIQVIPSKTVYRTNTALPGGTNKTVQKGHAGYKSRAYRILKLDGKVISRQLLSTDTYAQLETIIEKN